MSTIKDLEERVAKTKEIAGVYREQYERTLTEMDGFQRKFRLIRARYMEAMDEMDKARDELFYKREMERAWEHLPKWRDIR